MSLVLESIYKCSFRNQDTPHDGVYPGFEHESLGRGIIKFINIDFK